MRILWVKAGKLLPVKSGDNILTDNIARSLVQHHELTFFSYYDGSRDPDYEDQLAIELPRAVSLCTGKPELTTFRRALDYLWRLPSGAPYAISHFKSSIVRDQLDRWFKQASFDVVVCDFLDAAVNFPAEITIPSVLFQHNVESEIWRRHVLADGGRVKKLAYGIEFLKMLRYEERTVRKFQHVIAVSEQDRRLMAAWVDSARITVVPAGVNLETYRPHTAPLDIGPLVMFVGDMDWEPNADATEYFCREVWPLITATLPQARFRIVGRNPMPRVQELASASIEITGRVPSVVDHLREAAVVVVPLRVGGGAKLKIYEAMAMGKAVVSSSIGAEGLDVHRGRDIIVADDPQSFAEAVLKLLLSAEVRKSYEGAAAAAAVAAQFDWPSIGRRFADVLEQTAKAGARVMPVVERQT